MEFQRLISLYMSRHLSKKPSAEYYERLYKQFFASWKDHRTRFEIQDWHESLSATPTHANKALGMLKAMYAWAQRTGDHTGKRALWEADNPARGVRRHKTFMRERVFSDSELAKFFLYLDFFYVQLRVYLTMLLCTGCRMSEARLARWEHINFEEKAWIKPMTKNGRAQRMPIPTQVIEALKTLPRKEKSPYIFVGAYGRPWSRSGAEKAWKKVAIEMKMHDITLHDFRRTVATHLYHHTKDAKLVKAVLNHFDGSMEAVYIKQHYTHIATQLQAQADRFWTFKQEEVAHEALESPVVHDLGELPDELRPLAGRIGAEESDGPMGTELDPGTAGAA